MARSQHTCWNCVTNAEDTERLQACVQELAAILYRNTPQKSLTSLEVIEKSVRQHMLKRVSPEVDVSENQASPIYK